MPSLLVATADAMLATLQSVMACNFDQVMHDAAALKRRGWQLRIGGSQCLLWWDLVLCHACRSDSAKRKTQCCVVLRVPIKQVVVAHGDIVPAPGGKAAFTAGALAFFKDVTALRRRPGARARQLLLPGGVLAAVAAAAVGGAVLTGRAAWQLVGALAGWAAR